jgi:hypothetical protein
VYMLLNMMCTHNSQRKDMDTQANRTENIKEKEKKEATNNCLNGIYTTVSCHAFSLGQHKIQGTCLSGIPRFSTVPDTDHM